MEDSPFSRSPVENIDVSAATTESFLTPAHDVQDQTGASASNSDHQAAADMTESPTTIPKQSATVDESTRKNVEILKLMMKLRSTHTKAHYSRPRLLTLIACVSYMMFHLMGVEIGLRSIQSYTEPRLHQAKVQLDTTSHALAADNLLDVQLNGLLDTALRKRYDEVSYEDCLVRALRNADFVFYGLDFTSNPDIRNQTAEWVTSNCDRLFYSPQLHSMRSSKLRVHVEEIQQSIKKLLRFVRHRLTLLQCKLQCGNSQLATKSFLVESSIESEKRPRMRPDMPYGFSLECQDLNRCRLIHSGPATPDKTSKTLKDAVADARKEVEKWSYTHKFERMYRVIGYIYLPLAVLQPLLIMSYLLAIVVSLRRRHVPGRKRSSTEKKARVRDVIRYTVANFQDQERHAVGLLINTALYALLSFQLDYIIPEVDRLLLPVGLGLCAYHSVHAGVFLDPAPVDYPDESIYDAIGAVKDLYLIMNAIEVPKVPLQWRRASAAKKPAPSPATKPASKIAARFISPLTPIAEDLQQERKAMHVEQGKPLVDLDQYGYATETDEDDDSDAESGSYVDLAGRVTPTDSEDDDLVIVEE